jgi:hypothetical protein
LKPLLRRPQISYQKQNCFFPSFILVSTLGLVAPADLFVGTWKVDDVLRDPMEHHGTSWDEECGKIILWKAVSIATVKPPAKHPSK